jgi:hypothetical protein
MHGWPAECMMDEEALADLLRRSPMVRTRRQVLKDGEDRQPIHDPLAEIERHLIEAYLAGAGHHYDELAGRADDRARELLAEASQYASMKLSEIEARSRFLHDLRGEP